MCLLPLWQIISSIYANPEAVLTIKTILRIAGEQNHADVLKTKELAEI